MGDKQGQVIPKKAYFKGFIYFGEARKTPDMIYLLITIWGREFESSPVRHLNPYEKSRSFEGWMFQHLNPWNAALVAIQAGVITCLARDHQEAFEALRNPNLQNFMLFPFFVDDKPTSLIVAINEVMGKVLVLPLFVAADHEMELVPALDPAKFVTEEPVTR